MSAPLRALVVDDSAFARKVVREILAASPEIEVVGIARDGLEALERIAELAPDVVTLDLMMPNLDGLGVLRALAEMKSPVRVVVVSISGDDSEVALAALALGAVDLVRKPSALATGRLYEMGDELVRKVVAVARSRAPARLDPPTGIGGVPPAPRAWAQGVFELVVIGTSTGGPQALTTVVAALPSDLPVPVAIALHIPRDYTAALARRLDGVSALSVAEATDDLVLRPGMAVLARGGSNLEIYRVEGELRTRTSRPTGDPYVPSVDVLFRTAAQAIGGGVLGVVLTGMGDDGTAGARSIVAAGGRVLAEDESSCVVYGMPRSVAEAGLAHAAVPLAGMADAIVRLLGDTTKR